MIKNCEQCGAKMERESKYSHKQFLTRRFCSPRCKGIVQKPANLIHTQKHTPESRLKMSIANKGRPSGMKGKHHSEATKKLLRENGLGEKSFLWIDGRSSDVEYQRFRGRLKVHRRRMAPGSHSHQQWCELKKKFGFTCPACLLPEPQIKLTTDHVVPIFLGGSNDIGNIQPLCGKCNSKKSLKIIRYEVANNAKGN